MEQFERSDEYGFRFTYEKSVPGNATVILKVPRVSPNKRGVNDIGYAFEEGIKLYATVSQHPEKITALWQEIKDFGDINKSTAYIKIVNTSGYSRVVNISAVLN